MRPINEDRRRRALLLSKRLKELAVIRRQLVFRLEELDAETRAVKIEVNSLHNLDAPISTLPDEMLAMIFEAGSLLPQEAQYHFGSLVSHVSQHWRNIALTTPQLWNKMSCIKPEGTDYGDPYPSGRIQRDSTFLERSRDFPVEIYIPGFAHDKDLTQECIQLIRDHIGHCRRLSVTHSDAVCLSAVFEDLARKPAPLLSSIKMYYSEDSGETFWLDYPVFPLGTPHLITAQLHGIETSSLPFCLPAFTYVTSLQLTGLWIDDEGSIDQQFGPLRETLMALQTLNHLELQLHLFRPGDLHSPIVLPTVQFLQLHGRDNVCIEDIIRSICAESLATLSIGGRNRSEPGFYSYQEEELESHFPSLQHLILRNIFLYLLDLRVVARIFPGIERLTCHGQESLNPSTSDITHVISIISAAPHPRYRKNDEDDEGNATSRQHWPNLHTIAVKASDAPLDVVALHDEISRLQGAGHPIRKLKLPRHLCEMAGAEEMAHVRTVIEVEDFSMDWPTPFEFV